VLKIRTLALGIEHLHVEPDGARINADGFLSVRRLNRRLNSLALQFPGAAFHKGIEITLELAERLSCFHTRDSLEPLGDVLANVFVLIVEKGGDLLDVFVRVQVTREAQRLSTLLVVER